MYVCFGGAYPVTSPEWSWRGKRASQSSIASKSLVGRIMRVLEVLNLLGFVYVCIFFILGRLMPLVNILLLCHSISTLYSTCFRKWGERVGRGEVRFLAWHRQAMSTAQSKSLPIDIIGLA